MDPQEVGPSVGHKPQWGTSLSGARASVGCEPARLLACKSGLVCVCAHRMWQPRRGKGFFESLGADFLMVLDS